MSYNGSAAQASNLTAFNINTGSGSTPTWTVISEVTEFSVSGKANKTATVTNLQSTAEEFINTILAPGSYSLTFNRISADTGQAALYAQFVSGDLTKFEIVLPKTAAQTSSGDTYAFTALVEQFDDLSSVTPEKQIQSKVTLKVSGPVTFTVGS